MELLELVESIRAEEASVQRLYGGDGRSRAPHRHSQDVAYLVKLAEAAQLIADVRAGRRGTWVLQEAMSTSDFPNLLADIIDRQLLANYLEAPYSWSQYCRRNLVQDFRTVKRFAINGAEGTLPEVPQLDEYSAASLTESLYNYAVKKYGRRIRLSWELLINDDLGAFTDIPSRFGRAARRTEEKFVTQLFVDASGPHASFYTAGNSNLITGNPALSVNGLSAGITKLMSQVDADGEPIMVDAMTLVIPPALLATARSIVNATEIRIALSGGTSDYQTAASPAWTQDIVKIAVNYYIPIVASSANGATSWFLFADPNTSRPALEAGFLRGHETPEIFVKQPNAQLVGGGQAQEDFDTDSRELKVRHVVGGSRIEPKASVGSNGSGS